MKYRFEAQSITEIEGVLADFARSQAKTSWSLNGFSRFINSDSYVIFIDVSASQGARTAHARLLKRLRKLSWMQWGPYDHADLQYHVTIAGCGLTAENFQAIWDYVNQQPQPHFDLFFDNLALLKIESEIYAVYQQNCFQDL
jgi:2'-5' RNA ligase